MKEVYNFDKFGHTIRDAIEKKTKINLRREEVNYIYNLAAKKFQVGDYETSFEMFQFLTMYDIQNKLYIKSMAGCLHALKRYTEAYFTYQAVYMSGDNKKNDDCLFYMADCAIKTQDYENAGKLLVAFLESTHDKNLEKKAKLLQLGLEKLKEKDK